jgi:hypothetical protein
LGICEAFFSGTAMAGQQGEPADGHSRLLFDVFSACLLLLTALLGKQCHINISFNKPVADCGSCT